MLDLSISVMHINLKFLHITNFSPHISFVIFVTNIRYAGAHLEHALLALQPLLPLPQHPEQPPARIWCGRCHKKLIFLFDIFWHCSSNWQSTPPIVLLQHHSTVNQQPSVLLLFLSCCFDVFLICWFAAVHSKFSGKPHSNNWSQFSNAAIWT